MNLKMIMLSKRSQTKEYKLYDSIYLKFWKNETNLSDTNQTCGYLGAGGVEWKNNLKGVKETLEADGYTHCLDCRNGFRSTYMSKFIKLYI